MASPKSGSAGTAVTPTDPDPAIEADNADPGAVESLTASAAQTKAGQFDSAKTKPYKPPKTAADKAKKPSWIEIVLVDEKKNPVPGEPYQITLPDGETVASGTLDEKGFARVDGIDPGTCQITFPNRDQDAWTTA
jgi:type VI secretion system secreted protein VgrG